MTQVVSAAEGYVFHNRLTHTLEVAQIARRQAEKLVAERAKLAHSLGGIDAEVVEAAALAHDLGHPPFGHVGEKELDRLVCERGVTDGYEGNAQTFRIVTKLAVRTVEPGLNLTRATLNAILKYPWLRSSHGEHNRKFGAYATERREFEWARSLYIGDERKSAEAELMDWADDIAYAVHDVEDFYQAGLIPLDRLVVDGKEVERFLNEVFDRWSRTKVPLYYSRPNLSAAFRDLVVTFPVGEPYRGTRDQRASLRDLTSGLIGRYVGAVRLRIPRHPKERRIAIEPFAEMEITMLKELTWHYVIANPALAAQQHGQRRVLATLFGILLGATANNREVLPPGPREALEEAEAATPKAHWADARCRVVADTIAVMTEKQAFELHARLTGEEPGSVLNAILV